MNKIKNHKLQHRIWKIRWPTWRYNPEECTKNWQKKTTRTVYIYFLSAAEGKCSLQIWDVAANTFNKKSMAGAWRPSSLEVGSEKQPSLLLTATQDNQLCSLELALNTEATTHRLFSSRCLHRACNDKTHCNNYYSQFTIVKYTVSLKPIMWWPVTIPWLSI